MFEVEKPRRFQYTPRFYDPEKEKWEALKKKYAIEQEKKETAAGSTAADRDADDELGYFEQRVRDLDREAHARDGKLTWRDLFRKREMPRFNYRSRYSGTESADTGNGTPSGDNDESLVGKYCQSKHLIKIKRRFDIADTEYMKPISGTKIILYCFIVMLLLSIIFLPSPFSK